MHWLSHALIMILRILGVSRSVYLRWPGLEEAKNSGTTHGGILHAKWWDTNTNRLIDELIDSIHSE